MALIQAGTNPGMPSNGTRSLTSHALYRTRQAFRFFRTDRLASAIDGDRYPAGRVDLVRRFQDAISTVKVATQTPGRN